MDDLLGSRSVINTLDLDQAGAWVVDMAGALIAQVASPKIPIRQQNSSFSKSIHREQSRTGVFVCRSGQSVQTANFIDVDPMPVPTSSG